MTDLFFLYFNFASPDRKLEGNHWDPHQDQAPPVLSSTHSHEGWFQNKTSTASPGREQPLPSGSRDKDKPAERAPGQPPAPFLGDGLVAVLLTQASPGALSHGKIRACSSAFGLCGKWILVRKSKMHEVRYSVLGAMGSMGITSQHHRPPPAPALLLHGAFWLLGTKKTELKVISTEPPLWLHSENQEAKKQRICSNLTRCVILPLPA